MKIKILHLISVCVLSVMFAACGGENSVVTNTSFPEFRIVSSVLSVRGPQLDANGAGKFMDGDQNTIFFHSGDKVLQQGTYVYGHKYLWSDFHSLEGVKSCSVSACYPLVETKTPNNFTWNVAEHEGASDFLVSTPVLAHTTSSAPVVLSFKHVLHKLVVELYSKGSMPIDVLDKAEISVCNFCPIAHINLLEGNVVNASGALSNFTQVGKKTTFLIPSQEVADIEIVVKVDNRRKTYKLSAAQVGGQALKVLESGKSFTLRVGVSETEISILAQESSGWEEQGTDHGTIIF